MEALKKEVSIWFVEDYDMAVARYMVQGVDVWLNNPRRLEEASGTSGMKAAANFVPQISIIDGWWFPQDAPQGYRFPKGLVEGTTGWGIGREPTDADLSLLLDTDEARAERAADRETDGLELIRKIKDVLIPLYKSKEEWFKVCKQAAAYNAPWFNSHRLAKEMLRIYGLE